MRHSLSLLEKATICAALSIVLAGCSPLKVINILSRSDAQVIRAVAYGSGPRHKLDIYVPENADNAPVVVFFYGGSWNSGSRADYAFIGYALASRGMIAVIPDYRLYPEVRYPSFLEDSAQAVAWVAGHISAYHGNPHKLFVMGHSAGAYNAAMLALDGRWLGAYEMTPSALNGWIGLAGPYNFIPIENRDVRPVFFYPDTPTDSQPINHVTANAPPALLIAARDDELVNPVRNTGQLAEKLRENGVPVTETYYRWANHITLIGSLASPARRFASTLDDIDHFVTAHAEQSQVKQ